MSSVPVPVTPGQPPALAPAAVSSAPDTVKVVRKLIWLPIMLAILGATAAYLITGGRGYSAQALLKLGTQNIDQQILGLASEGATNSNLIIAETVANIDQLDTARATKGLLAGSPNLTPTEIDEKVEVSVDTKTFLISVTAKDKSPFIASKLSNFYVQAYIDIVETRDLNRLNEIEAQLRKRLAELRRTEAETLNGLSAEQKDLVRRTLAIQPAA
ncbi:MAG: hypothetical protein JHD16_09795, partial [Solirubrobacteraceae bacterium]|nr:hypothetical protein [Solirubrobacteraceae bacterium]